ncbi:MAG TPA: serine kinase [Firmicutes bacterium]|nr:serine kinase [Bacillota bacterium]HOQ24607.1 DRTGG domain-containing protein [Bacillota bacterium]HPT67809.1 DRTGG domain-containing protein [Bacillota bacterium]
MKLSELVTGIEAVAVCGEQGLAEKEVAGAYVSDLLSDVMGRAKEGEVWLTIQTHPNVVAVAVLLNLAAIIFTAGHEPEEQTKAKAEEEGIILLKTALSTYETAGRIYQLLTGAGRA